MQNAKIGIFFMDHYLKKRKVVIFTDCYDLAFNEIAQVIWNHVSPSLINSIHIDPVVAIKKFSTVNAAFAVRLFAELYPSSTIFLVVMNSMDNSPSRIIVETNNNLILVGNNSGYFNWLIEDIGLKSVYENSMQRETNPRSFGGKYVQAPTVASILNGKTLDTLGNKRSKEILADFKIPNGTVVHCDNFGLIKIKGEPLNNVDEGQRMRILINNKIEIEAIFSHQLKTHLDGTWVLFPGSSLYGLPELGKVRCPDSAESLNVKEGDFIVWEKV